MRFGDQTTIRAEIRHVKQIDSATYTAFITKVLFTEAYIVIVDTIKRSLLTKQSRTLSYSTQQQSFLLIFCLWFHPVLNVKRTASRSSCVFVPLSKFYYCGFNSLALPGRSGKPLFMHFQMHGVVSEFVLTTSTYHQAGISFFHKAFTFEINRK